MRDFRHLHPDQTGVSKHGSKSRVGIRQHQIGIRDADPVRGIFHQQLEGAQFFFLPLQRGNILVHAQNADNLAIAAQRRLGGAQPDRRAIAARQLFFDIEPGSVGDHGAIIFLIPGCVCFPRHLKVGLADYFVNRGQSGIDEKTVVTPQETQLVILPEHSLRQVVDHQLQHGATLA
jgi:hypothetical protein